MFVEQAKNWGVRWGDLSKETKAKMLDSVDIEKDLEVTVVRMSFLWYKVYFKNELTCSCRLDTSISPPKILINDDEALMTWSGDFPFSMSEIDFSIFEESSNTSSLNRVDSFEGC